MGFIEDQRRERQKEIEAERQLELARQAESEREEERRASAIREIARRRALYEESLRRFEQSGLPTLISELGKLGRYQYFYERERMEDSAFLFNYNNPNLLSMYNTGETHVCGMTISTKEIGEKIEQKSIEIETDAEGTIWFKAGPLGSSIVSQSHWQRDRDALERALGKAYNHPKVERYKPSPPTPPEVGHGM